MDDILKVKADIVKVNYDSLKKEAIIKVKVKKSKKNNITSPIKKALHLTKESLGGYTDEQFIQFIDSLKIRKQNKLPIFIELNKRELDEDEDDREEGGIL